MQFRQPVKLFFEKIEIYGGCFPGGDVFCKKHPLRASPLKTPNSAGIFVPYRHKNACRYRFSLEGSGTFLFSRTERFPK
jgi:hypothetical protein